jgi:hypothetical protein
MCARPRWPLSYPLPVSFFLLVMVGCSDGSGLTGGAGRGDLAHPELGWMTTAGGLGVDRAMGVTLDGAGGVYIHGEVEGGGGARFGSVTLPLEASLFVARYLPGGELVSAHGIHPPGVSWMRRVTAVDALGNAYVGSQELITSGDEMVGRAMVVARFGLEGDLLWARSPQGAHEGTIDGIAVDVDGNVYVSATVRGFADFGTAQVTHEDGDFALVKYGPDGRVLWARQGHAPYDAGGGPVAVAANGDVIAAGRFTLALSLGGTYLQGGVDAFVSRYTPEGTVRWAVRIGGSALQVVNALATDASGNVYVAGTFSGSTDFGPVRLTSCGQWGFTDPYLAKLAPDGTVLWVRRGCGEGGDAEAAAVAVDDLGYAVLAGSFLGGSIRFVDTTFRSQGWWDSYVVRYTPDGTEVWAGHLAGPSDVYVQGVGVSHAGDAVYLTGGFDGVMTVGATTVNSRGSHDVFLARLVP